MSAHRLEFDASRCDGHGICALRCPEQIGLDGWGFAVVDPAPIEDAHGLRQARAAAAACPNRALRLLPVPAGRPQTGEVRVQPARQLVR